MFSSFSQIKFFANFTVGRGNCEVLRNYPSGDFPVILKTFLQLLISADLRWSQVRYQPSIEYSFNRDSFSQDAKKLGLKSEKFCFGSFFRMFFPNSQVAWTFRTCERKPWEHVSVLQGSFNLPWKVPKTGKVLNQTFWVLFTKNVFSFPSFR